jgi:hypothetical protein
VLVEEIDGLDLEAPQRAFDALLDVRRLAVLKSKPNLVAITTCPRKGAKASPTSSSLANGP